MPFWRRREDSAQEADLGLVVGLGNPGSKYERTRHNAGAMVVRRLAARHGLTFRSSRQRAEIARGTVAGRPVLLALPVTYMNDSGIAVSRLVRYFHVELGRLLVVCDDLDLPFGTIRLRPHGSSGGNGGLKSIIYELGTEQFARLRVGVSRPSRTAVGHVLSTFDEEEERRLPRLLDIAADAVTCALEKGVTLAMNQYNRDWLTEL